MRIIVEPRAHRFAPVSRHADRERSSTYRRKRLGGRARTPGDIGSVVGDRTDRHDPVELKATVRRNRLGERGASSGATPKRSVGRDVDLDQHAETLSEPERAAFASATPASVRSTLCTTSKSSAIAFALFVCTCPMKCFARRRQPIGTSPSLLARSFRRSLETGARRFDDRLDRLLLAHADDRSTLPGARSATRAARRRLRRAPLQTTRRWFAITLRSWPSPYASRYGAASHAIHDAERCRWGSSAARRVGRR